MRPWRTLIRSAALLTWLAATLGVSADAEPPQAPLPWIDAHL